MNKTVQDLKMEIEAIKKTQIEGILEMKNLRKRIGTTESSITKQIQAKQTDSEEMGKDISYSSKEKSTKVTSPI